jgi:carboxypeptidase C (cathepsin A)
VLTSLDVTRQWDWGDGGPSGSNVTDDLAEVMSTSPHLRVLSLNGYYDLRTPFLGTEYQLAHLGVSPAVHRQITIKYYRAGHMIFIDPKARSEMKRDLDDFYDSEPAAALDSRGHLRSAAE